MEEVIKTEGKHTLEGTVRISGSKNATVTLIPTAILANGPATICGVPKIFDVQSLSILPGDLGVLVDIRSSDTIAIDPTSVENRPLVQDAVNRLRTSYYSMGALLDKYSHVEIKIPGGCYLGPRPTDLHLKGFEALGTGIRYDHGSHILDVPQLTGTRISLDIASMGATINIMMATVHTKGRTTTKDAAEEPEIIDVVALLNKIGVDTRSASTNVIMIDGVDQLTGCSHEIIPDRIEAATYIVLAATATKKVRTDSIIPHHLEVLLSRLKEIGIGLEIGTDNVMIRTSRSLKAADTKTLPYPGLATDIQQPLTALLMQTQGQLIVTETIYTERFKYCRELNKMGANISVMIPSSFINRPTLLPDAKVYTTDLGYGACLVIAGLTTGGMTTIHNIYYIERGYEHIDGRLTAPGVKIWRETIE